MEESFDEKLKRIKNNIKQCDDYVSDWNKRMSDYEHQLGTMGVNHKIVDNPSEETKMIFCLIALACAAILILLLSLLK